ncbi:MAG: hypothetical protein JXA94_05275 [Parachlamydiales bacterium]|nr:hypothetical protein [Parachlamydiales bacterium]
MTSIVFSKPHHIKHAKLFSEDQNDIKIIHSIINELYEETLTSLRLTFEWIELFVKDTKTLKPIKLFIHELKIAEDIFCFTDLGKSISNVFSSSIKYFKYNDRSVVSDLRTSSFDLIYHFSKVFNWFKKNQIFSLGSKFLANFSLVGNITSALSDSESLYNEGIKIFSLNKKNSDLKNIDLLNVKKLSTIIRIAKYICLLSTPIFFAINLFFTFQVSTFLSLVIASISVVSTISSTILDKQFKI